MPYALSSNTAATLSSFFSLQDQMGTLQNQLATGKKINDPSDNMSVYFKAQSYQTKADFLDDTNGNIALSLEHLKLTNKSLSNMIDNLKSSRQTLVDALSKPAAVGGFAVNNFGAANGAQAVLNTAAKTYANAPAVPGQAGNPPVLAQVQQDGVIVAAARSNTMFQAGDVFAVTVQDSSNGTTSTRYFKAAAVPTAPAGNNTPDAATAAANALRAGNAQVNGTTAATAFSFYDLKTMAAAIQQAFGTDTLTANTQVEAQVNGQGGGTKFGLSLNTTTQSISFAQVRGQGGAGDLDNNNAMATNVVAPFDFGQLMGTSQTANNAYGGQGQASTVTLASLGAGALNVGLTQAQQTAQGNGTTTSYTFSGVGGQANNAGVQARQQAATQLANTLISVDNLLNAGGLPGFVNMFAGQAMAVNVNEDGSQQYNVNLNAGGAVTVVSLGFAGFQAGTGQTNIAGANGVNFTNGNGNGNITTAIATVDAALGKLTAYSATITAATAGIASRLDFNKSMVDSLKAGVTAMTAANTADVSANLSNMQNAGTLILAAMAKSSQVDQSISRLF
jgi:hypothetical protein